LREEAKETEARRIEKIPAHENLPGGWVSFCKIISDNVARGRTGGGARAGDVGTITLLNDPRNCQL
jgi:hypothetical protein